MIPIFGVPLVISVGVCFQMFEHGFVKHTLRVQVPNYKVSTPSPPKTYYLGTGAFKGP